MLVGGEGHKTGHGGDTTKRYEDLAQWIDRQFGLKEVVSRFCAHDYGTADQRPFVGPIRPGSTSTFVATGFNKWGFTNAAAGAQLVAGKILEATEPSWAQVFSTTRLPATNLGGVVSTNAQVGFDMVKDWLSAVSSNGMPKPGQGAVVRRGAKPVAVSRDEVGSVCEVSGVCPHLGGILQWNPAEETWDCPLHGSRFHRDGRLLHGPATSDLKTQ